MESTNNQTFVPLGSNKTYIGTYDVVSAYTSAKISLISDQDCEVRVYQSQNKKNTFSVSFQATANVQLEEYLTLSNPFVYFTVRNKSSTAQTVLNFTVIYTVNQVKYSMKGNSVFWNDETVNNDDVSLIVSSGNTPTHNISVFGNTDAETTLTLQMSADGLIFYDSQNSIVANGNFGYSISCPFYYLRLKSSTSCQITALVVFS